MGGQAGRPGHLHRRIDGGVGGAVEEDQLGDAQPQDILGERRLGRQRGRQAMGDQSVDLTQPAQRRRHQQASEGPVAFLQPAGIEGVVQRQMAAQHLDQSLERRGAGAEDPAGRKGQGHGLSSCGAGPRALGAHDTWISAKPTGRRPGAAGTEAGATEYGSSRKTQRLNQGIGMNTYPPPVDREETA